LKEQRKQKLIDEANRLKKLQEEAEKEKILDLQNNLIFDLYPARPLKQDTKITIRKDSKLQLYIILFLIIIVSCEEIVFDILYILDSKMTTPLEDMQILLWVKLGLVILQTLSIFLYLDIIFVRNHTDFFVVHKSVTLLFSCFFGSISIVNNLSRL